MKSMVMNVHAHVRPANEIRMQLDGEGNDLWGRIHLDWGMVLHFSTPHDVERLIEAAVDLHTAWKAAKEQSNDE